MSEHDQMAARDVVLLLLPCNWQGHTTFVLVLVLHLNLQVLWLLQLLLLFSLMQPMLAVEAAFLPTLTLPWVVPAQGDRHIDDVIC